MCPSCASDKGPNLVPSKDGDAESTGKTSCLSTVSVSVPYPIDWPVSSIPEAYPYRNKDEGTEVAVYITITSFFILADHLAFHNIIFSPYAVNSNTCFTIFHSLRWQKTGIP